MKAPEGARKNHTNSGGYKGGLAATFHETRLKDAEDITGGGCPPVHGPTKAIVRNAGGYKGGMAATHDQSEKPDIHELPVDGAGMAE